MIHLDNELLITYGASIQELNKGDFLFQENGVPHFFYQLIEGKIKMFTIDRQGKEMIQGFFTAGNSFGEPPIFNNRNYPSSAIAMKDSLLIKLSKVKLFELIEDNPKVAFDIIQGFSEKLYQKTTTIQILGCSDPEEKILLFLEREKQFSDITEKIKIPYTRQQIANFTGLCVETVIRTLLKLNEEKVVEIRSHKVYY